MKGISCILPAPTKQSTFFGGKPISQAAIARAANIDKGYLSRVLLGKQNPSIKVAVKIAQALEMTLPQFISILEEKSQQHLGVA